MRRSFSRQVVQDTRRLGLWTGLAFLVAAALGLGLALSVAAPAGAATPGACPPCWGPDPCISGTVTLEGRPPRGTSPSWLVPLRFTVFWTGTQTILFECDTTTDIDGHFLLGELPDGTYDLAVKNLHTLRNRLESVSLVSQTTYVLDFGTLREGDANDSNQVEVYDFSILATAYNSSPPDPRFDARADFNQNYMVELFDFSLLATNFNLSGDLLPAPARQQRGEADASPVMLRLSPSARTVRQGDTFVSQIEVLAGALGVDAVSVFIRFDPAQLQVVDFQGLPATHIEPSDAMPNVLWNAVDGASGTVEFAVGRALAEEPPTGTFAVGTIRFRSVGPAGEALVNFAADGPHETGVAFQGDDVLGEVLGQSVRLRESLLLLPFVGHAAW